MADTMEWLVRALFLALGAGVGYGLRGYQVERENRRRIKAVEDKVDVHPDTSDRGAVSLAGALRGILPGIALAATLVAVVLTSNTNSRIDSVSTCSEDAITATVTALNERNSVNGEQLDRQRALNSEQKRFLEALMPTVTAVQRTDLERYVRALDEAIRAIDRVRQKRLETKYPTEETIRQCIRDGGP